MLRSVLLLLGVIFIVCIASPATSLARVNASGNTALPSQSTSYNLSGGGNGTFSVTEDVALDPASGPWLKSLINSSGSGISSGADRDIVETLTNVGEVPWLDWHESIVSRTTINQPDDSPGFLFDQNSLLLSANYGSGFITLTQGTDYTLVPTPFPGGPSGNLGNWEAIDIFFSPNRVIATGNALKIQKSIFEVFGDADVWRPGEAAIISEYPSPEPGSLVLAAMGIPLLIRRRQFFQRKILS